MCADARHTLAFGTTSVQPGRDDGGSELGGGEGGGLYGGIGEGGGIVGGRGGEGGGGSERCFYVVLCLSHRLGHACLTSSSYFCSVSGVQKFVEVCRSL